MLPNRIVLIVVLLVYHTRTTSPLWRPYYDRYPLTITDRVRYYRLAYVVQKYALSVKLISLFVNHTNVPGYHNRLCDPVTSGQRSCYMIAVFLLYCWRRGVRSSTYSRFARRGICFVADSRDARIGLERVSRLWRAQAGVANIYDKSGDYS